MRNYVVAFNKMREANLGKVFDRRELSLLASEHGIYINSSLWQSGLAVHFEQTKIGPKLVYLFKNTAMTEADWRSIRSNRRLYDDNVLRKIEHAKAILKRYGVDEL